MKKWEKFIWEEYERVKDRIEKDQFWLGYVVGLLNAAKITYDYIYNCSNHKSLAT